MQKIFTIYILAVIFIVLFFPLNIVHLTAKYAVNIPFWDDWDCILPLIEKFHTHSLHFIDWWRDQNLHRIVLTRLIYFADYLFFAGSRFVTIGLEIIIQSILFFLFAIQARSMFPERKVVYWLLLIPFSALIFAPQIGSEWYLAFCCYTLNALFFCLAVFTLNTATDNFRKNLLVILFGVLSSFSLFNGLIIWPTLVAMLILRRESWRKVAIYSLIGLIVCIIYYPGLTFELPKVQVHTTLLDKINYFLAFIGSVFSRENINTGRTVGLIALVLYSFCFYKILQRNCSADERNKSLAWLCIGFLGIGSAILGVLGRSQMGIDEALADRYIVLVVPFWCGLIVAVTFLYGKAIYQKKYLATLLIVTIFTLSSFYVTTGKLFTLRALQLIEQISRASFALSENAYIVDPTLPFGLLHPLPTTTLNGVKFLKANDFALFNDQQTSLIGTNIKQDNLILSDKSIPGDFDSIKPTNGDVDTCDYQLHRGFFVSGNLKSSQRFEMTYILDENHTVWGLGEKDYMQYDRHKISWSGFVISPPRDKAQQTQLQVWVKFRGSNELFPIPTTQVMKNGLGCSKLLSTNTR